MNTNGTRGVGRPVRRRTVRGLALAAALALTGCGVQATDVIEAGGPATVLVIPGEGNWMLVFFETPDGELIPVPRPLTNGTWGGATPVTLGQALKTLLDGPTKEERAAGLRTGLPKLSAVGNKLGVGANEEGSATAVFLPLRLADLDDRAVEQVVCTIAYAGSPSGTRPVALHGTDVDMEATTCRVDVNRDDVSRPATSAPSGRTWPRPQTAPTKPAAPPESGSERFPSGPPPTGGTPPPATF
ncbi:hypothetical protein ACFV0R_12135 [Streptomyces sp. NPDC059578]|uniref:hypothetical protein n=1 Tax=Streptomyces sp. NPDC059578 TaxID=3346874 RepID=UPI0036B444B3